MIRASSIPAERAAGKLIGSTITVSEKPILFSAPMILEILAGTKAVTRRVVKPPPPSWATEVGVSAFTQPSMLSARGNHPEHGPSESFIKQRYAVGDRLRVRETWQTWTRQSDGCNGIRFRADESFMPIENTREAADLWIETHDNGSHGTDWRPSIFMPLWASRITLEVTDVKVERLQDITEEQAKAEGVDHHWCDQPKFSHSGCCGYRVNFERLWTEINGKRPGCSWADNPFVWAISFSRFKP